MNEIKFRAYSSTKSEFVQLLLLITNQLQHKIMITMISVYRCYPERGIFSALEFYSVLNGGGLDPQKSTTTSGIATLNYGTKSKLHYKVRRQKSSRKMSQSRNFDLLFLHFQNFFYDT